MGLDMYLNASVYVPSDFWNNGVTTENPTYEKIMEALDIDKSKTDGGLTVEVGVGYWRKANAIHNWFVLQLADGVDECQRIPVVSTDLVTLRSLCTHLVEEKNPEVAMRLLPPTSGFFFGSTSIDEWYWEDLKHTIEVINNAFEIDNVHAFTYQASW